MEPSTVTMGCTTCGEKPNASTGYVCKCHRENDDAGGITPEGLALGHRYVMGHINAYCPKCSDEHGVAVLDCDYDLDK